MKSNSKTIILILYFAVFFVLDFFNKDQVHASEDLLWVIKAIKTTFLLLLLSILLIYSLMIGDVEEKTYEFGMLRALGFGKVMLVILLTF